MSPTETLVNQVWSYCNVRGDAGLNYGDYLQQLTYLIFLKMADYTARWLHGDDKVSVPNSRVA